VKEFAMAELSSTSFSEIDASNNAPSPSGFPEGMNMSGLNDSGRAVMAAVKRFWGRIQGRYASTGSSNAYALTPDVPLGAYVTGERYSFRANFTNSAAATLNISTLGTRAIKKMALAGKVNLAAGDIQSGQPVTVEYDGTDMVMTTPATTDPVPSGTVVAYAGAASPSGWLLCDGVAVSRTTFAALFAAIATSYGAGDGSTTFNVPDLRGRVGVGKDDMGGSPANRAQVSTTINTTNGASTASVASAAGLAIGMTVVSANIPAATTIAAINGTTLTLSANATGTASGVAARFSFLSDAQLLGASGGSLTHTLVTAQMPAHTHTYNDWASAGTGTVAAGANFGTGIATGSAGGGQSHPNMQPSILLNYLIKV
jgi:microcystin-dependent protein